MIGRRSPTSCSVGIADVVAARVVGEVETANETIEAVIAAKTPKSRNFCDMSPSCSSTFTSLALPLYEGRHDMLLPPLIGHPTRRYSRCFLPGLIQINFIRKSALRNLSR